MRIGWKQIQNQKKFRHRKKIIREVLTILAIAIGFVLVAGWAGGTYPY